MARAARTYSQTFNGTIRVALGGRYFKLLETVNGVNVELYNKGQQVLLATDVDGGFYLRTEFDELAITTGASELVSWLVSDEEGGSDRFTGEFTLSAHPKGSAHTPSAETVTNASSTLLAANANRRYLLIQNQDPSANIWIRCDGGVAVANAACIKLGPGEVWEPLVPPTGAVNAIADVASTSLIHAIEA